MDLGAQGPADPPGEAPSRRTLASVQKGGQGPLCTVVTGFSFGSGSPSPGRDPLGRLVIRATQPSPNSRLHESTLPCRLANSASTPHSVVEEYDGPAVSCDLLPVVIDLESWGRLSSEWSMGVAR